MTYARMTTDANDGGSRESMMSTVTFRRRPGVKVEVHGNRVEVTTGLWPFLKHQTIPFRNISSVDVARFTNRLVIQTNDGDDYKYALGYLFAGKAKRAKQAIAERM